MREVQAGQADGVLDRHSGWADAVSIVQPAT
jgi:hypothetical protein